MDLNLVIFSLPSLPQITALSLYNETRALFQFPAIVSALSNVIKYVRSKVYKCVVCKEDFAVNRNKDGTVSTARGGISKEIFLCKNCGSTMVEDAALRLSGDRVLARFTPYTTLSSGNCHHRHQAITLSVKDELCFGLELGVSYNIVLSRDLRVWGYEPLLPHPLRALPFFPQPINRFIHFVRRNSGGSPLALVTALSAQLDRGIYPPAAFLQLKTALLLSTASLGMCECGVSVLALGDSSRLMISAMDSCPRLLRTTVSHPQGTTSTESPYYNWREAGSLLLSSQAVSYVGDVSRINSPFISQILKAVDSEVVSQVGKNEKFKLPLKTVIWAHWNCDKYSFHDTNQLKTLINIFGLPFMGESNIEEDELARYILTRAVDPSLNYDYLIEVKDFRTFLELVTPQKVEMTPMASSLIRNYFVASRQERPESLPVRSIKIMTRMAESCARINLRSVVLHEDALLAAFLYEESLAALFGPSLYSPPLDRCLSGTDRFLDVVTKMDDTFMKFSLWLDQYTKTLSTSLANNSLT